MEIDEMKNRLNEYENKPGSQNRENPQSGQNTDRVNTYRSRILSKGILLLGLILILIPFNTAEIMQTGENIYRTVPAFVPAASGKVFGSIRSFVTGGEASQDQVVVPLSNPGEPGRLNLQFVRGSLQVTGYNGEEVIIRYDGVPQIRDEDREEVRPNGLRRISGGSPGFEAVEDNNVVTIRNVSVIGKFDFDILVPVNFSLNLSMVSGDTLSVENVNGELEISHVNGNVNIIDAGGSAVVNTVNGKIVAEFRSVAPDKPMAFSTINGDIDVSLPSDAGFNTRMKSEFGAMYTDFDMDVQREEKVRNGDNLHTNVSVPYRVSVHEWISAEVNEGGPEYRFNTLRGNIYIRKR